MKIYKSQVNKFFPQHTTLGDFLFKLTQMKEEDLMDAALKGAVWIQRKGKGKILRIRSLKETVYPLDVIQFFYDPKVLKLPTLQKADSLFENDHYGIWIKPAGVVPQGSQTGDHASLLRYVEKVKKKEVFLVHRLDRETRGLMIVAYNSKAAGLLSDLFQKNKIHKEYEAIVLGEMPVGHTETITVSLDDKEAITHIKVIESNSKESLLAVTIDTGKLHQIRRHLDFIGHPVMGDPKYGRGNKNQEGLKLLARSLAFEDPWQVKPQKFILSEGLTL